MRTVDTAELRDAVSELFIKANYRLTPDVEAAIRRMRDAETAPAARTALGAICENLGAAEEMRVPICQDTGMAVVFIDLGQDVHLSGAPLEDAVNEGVARAYREGYMRCSVVRDPLRRVNTDDNTPAVIHTRIVPGDRVRLVACPKGFGSENMSAVRMFTPAATREDILDFIADTAERAGSNPCPPIVVGVGIGGTFEYCALLAKKALCRPLDRPHPDPFYAEMEREATERVNRTGVGAQGFGGRFTALGVGIETFPTHIAGLPVAVNIGCHVTRHAEIVL